jgi:hypothetical protein
VRPRLIVAVLAVAVGTSVSAAFAHHANVDNMYKTANAQWTCSNGSFFCRTDNSSLFWAAENSVSDEGRANIQWWMEAILEPTDLTVTEELPVYTGSAETDIIFRVVPMLPGEAWGMTWCQDAVSTARCDQHYMDFSAQRLLEFGFAATPPASLICHETGHAIGLTHGYDAAPRISDLDGNLGCMMTPFPIDLWDLWGHNIGQINAQY